MIVTFIFLLNLVFIARTTLPCHGSSTKIKQRAYAAAFRYSVIRLRALFIAMLVGEGALCLGKRVNVE